LGLLASLVRRAISADVFPLLQRYFPPIMDNASMPENLLSNMFNELAILLFAAVRLRQPLIVAFIVMGVLVGPVGMDVIRSTEQLNILAEMGLALLLLRVGGTSAIFFYPPG
jgi:hypothetical protein